MFAIFGLSTQAQTEKCATMQILEKMQIVMQKEEYNRLPFPLLYMFFGMIQLRTFLLPKFNLKLKF
ncbi:MAG: hypothetical protein EBR35_02690 [Flavobacteriales bacterium]|nr:hypothetical protein [Flavobacteriales bacterium]